MINNIILLTAQMVEQKALVDNTFEIPIELILSIFAIVISIATPVFEFLWNKRASKVNLESELYKDMIRGYLIKKIPEARQYIHYRNNCLDGTDELINVLNNLRRDIIFFKYKDKNYYENLYKLLQNLEDQLVMQKELNSDEFVRFFNNMDQKMEEIYAVLMQKYIGN